MNEYRIIVSKNEMETIKEALYLSIEWDEKAIKEMEEDEEDIFYRALIEDIEKNKKLIKKFQDLPI